jgi:hypothetical protein
MQCRHGILGRILWPDQVHQGVNAYDSAGPGQQVGQQRPLAVAERDRLPGRIDRGNGAEYQEHQQPSCLVS